MDDGRARRFGGPPPVEGGAPRATPRPGRSIPDAGARCHDYVAATLSWREVAERPSPGSAARRRSRCTGKCLTVSLPVQYDGRQAMDFLHCPNCHKRTGHKRALGFGTLFLVLLTLGGGLLLIPFYAKRCIVCGMSGGNISPEGQHVIHFLLIALGVVLVWLWITGGRRDPSWPTTSKRRPRSRPSRRRVVRCVTARRSVLRPWTGGQSMECGGRRGTRGAVGAGIPARGARTQAQDLPRRGLDE
jgi:hypothetical protein